MISISYPQIAQALTCNVLAEQDVASCQEITSSSLSDKEKQQLIADLMYPDTNYANHNFIYDWNTKMSFDTVPNGVETKSKGYIKDAWIKIIAVMPSVILENKHVTPGIGQVLSAYNYKVEIPSGTEAGDCKTDFSLVSNQNWLNVYLNENVIGTETLAEFSGSNVLNFKDTLKIQTVTEVDHYKKHVWCCEYGIYGGCAKYCSECKYASTEHRTHEVALEDTKTAHQYWPVIQPTIKAVDKYLNTVVGILDISNFDAFSLSFENSSFKQFNYYYDLDVSLAPYDVFTLRANNFTRKEANNIIVEESDNGYKFYVSDADNCQLDFYDHFHSWEQSCSLDYDFPLLTIETDKLYYDENDIIAVDLEPKDTLIDVKYGDQAVKVKSNAEFEAELNVNKITANLDGREAQRIIHVKRENTWAFVLNFGVFAGILYFYYSLFKKYVLWT